MASDKGKIQATIEFVGEDKVSGISKQVAGNMKKVTAEQERSQGMMGNAKAQWALYAAGINGAIGAATALFQVVGKVGDLVKEGTKAMAIEDAFRRAVPAADELIRKMEEATAFTIDETSLLRFGAKMRRAGIDVEKIPQIMNLATKAAVATGTEITQAVKLISDTFIKLSLIHI